MWKCNFAKLSNVTQNYLSSVSDGYLEQNTAFSQEFVKISKGGKYKSAVQKPI